jgi:hypothetical protein
MTGPSSIREENGKYKRFENLGIDARIILNLDIKYIVFKV